jgi:hypothetical protein
MRDRKNHSLMKKLEDAIRRLLRQQPPQPEDPYAYVMAPVGTGPKGRSGAAVAEIEDDSYRSFPPRQS